MQVKTIVDNLLNRAKAYQLKSEEADKIGNLKSGEYFYSVAQSCINKANVLLNTYDEEAYIYE